MDKQEKIRHVCKGFEHFILLRRVDAIYEAFEWFFVFRVMLLPRV